MGSFDEFWDSLPGKLTRGTQLQGWSKEQGYTELRFTIVEVSSQSIRVFSAGMKMPRNISKADAKNVWSRWPDYRDGKIGRAEMTQLSQNTSYLLALIKWHQGL